MKLIDLINENEIDTAKKIKRAKTIVKAYSEGEIEYGKHKDSHLYYQLVNIPEPETHFLLGVIFNFTGSIVDNIKIKIDNEELFNSYTEEDKNDLREIVYNRLNRHLERYGIYLEMALWVK